MTSFSAWSCRPQPAPAVTSQALTVRSAWRWAASAAGDARAAADACRALNSRRFRVVARWTRLVPQLSVDGREVIGHMMMGGRVKATSVMSGNGSYMEFNRENMH